MCPLTSASRGIVRAILLACTLASVGCAKLPATAPTISEVERQAINDTAQGFIVIEINDAVAAAALRFRQEGFIGAFANKSSRADLRIAVGDALQITIIEVGTGLFGQANNAATLGAETSTASATSLQPIVVAQDGNINVPFANRIHVAGETPEEVRSKIERLLSKKAVTPQVEVNVLTTGENNATVVGEVARPGLVPLALYGTRLLDLLANCGGARFPPYESNVRLTRNGRTMIVSMQAIVEDPRQNIYIQPRDTVYITHEPRTFTMFGATGKVGHYSFDSAKVSLAEAVAKGGGFLTNQSDPAGAFLFRYEPASFVKRVHPELTGRLPPIVPVVYRLNFRESDGYFRAQRFPVRDKDVLMISEAEGAQLLKFFTLVRGVTGIVGDLQASSGRTAPVGSF